LVGPDELSAFSTFLEGGALSEAADFRLAATGLEAADEAFEDDL